MPLPLAAAVSASSPDFWKVPILTGADLMSALGQHRMPPARCEDSILRTEDGAASGPQPSGPPRRGHGQAGLHPDTAPSPAAWGGTEPTGVAPGLFPSRETCVFWSRLNAAAVTQPMARVVPPEATSEPAGPPWERPPARGGARQQQPGASVRVNGVGDEAFHIPNGPSPSPLPGFLKVPCWGARRGAALSPPRRPEQFLSLTRPSRTGQTPARGSGVS